MPRRIRSGSFSEPVDFSFSIRSMVGSCWVTSQKNDSSIISPPKKVTLSELDFHPGFLRVCTQKPSLDMFFASWNDTTGYSEFTVVPNNTVEMSLVGIEVGTLPGRLQRHGRGEVFGGQVPPQTWRHVSA